MKIKTIMPTAIRYQPNHESGFFVNRFMNHFIVSNAVAKATTAPRAMRDHCVSDIFGIEPSSTTLAPNMVGIPRRKEKATICPREIPSLVPPINVAPLRDTPGMKANIWAQPIMKACL